MRCSRRDKLGDVRMEETPLETCQSYPVGERNTQVPSDQRLATGSACRLKPKGTETTKGTEDPPAVEANRILGRTGERLLAAWCSDYWIRGDLEKQKIRRYIRNNPVEMNLCRVPEEWPWGGANQGRKKPVTNRRYSRFPIGATPAVAFPIRNRGCPLAPSALGRAFQALPDTQGAHRGRLGWRMGRRGDQHFVKKPRPLFKSAGRQSGFAPAAALRFFVALGQSPAQAASDAQCRHSPGEAPAPGHGGDTR